MTRAVPTNLNYFSEEHSKKKLIEWLECIKKHVMDAFRSDIYWINITGEALSEILLSKGDLMVAVHPGTNEGHLIRMVWAGAEYKCLLTIKTDSGILTANDIANWLTVALHRLSRCVSLRSCDPGEQSQKEWSTNLTRDEKMRYKLDPWTVRSGKWPTCDVVAGTTHWNDGHYGVLCFIEETLPPDLAGWLAKNLLGWVIHLDPGNKAQIIFRTTNSNWKRKAGK